MIVIGHGVGLGQNTFISINPPAINYGQPHPVQRNGGPLRAGVYEPLQAVGHCAFNVPIRSATVTRYLTRISEFYFVPCVLPGDVWQTIGNIHDC